MDEIEALFNEAAAWSDERLTAELAKAALGERRSLLGLLIRLSEFDRRKLPESKGYPSAYEYCARILKHSRAAAYRRVSVARKGRRFRSLLRMIRDGDLCLSAAAQLAPLLTSENHERLLRRASGPSKEEVERMVASLDPKRARRESVRVLAVPPMPDVQAAAMPGPPVVAPPPPADSPTAEEAASSGAGQGDRGQTDLFGQPADRPEQLAVQTELYELRFTASKATLQMLARAKEVLRHRFPSGAADEIIALALSELLDRHDRDRRSSDPTQSTNARRSKRPASGKRSRYVPEAVKQAVHERDGGRCAFVGSEGLRCNSRAWLEYDHKLAYALGSASDDPEGLQQYCRPHNLLVGRRAFGGPYPERE